MCEAEKVSYSPDGLEAIIFTAEGDMRNALNNLQATHSGFGHIDQANVFKVCTSIEKSCWLLLTCAPVQQCLCVAHSGERSGDKINVCNKVVGGLCI